jgi:hypothetical protein
MAGTGPSKPQRERLGKKPTAVTVINTRVLPPTQPIANRAPDDGKSVRATIVHRVTPHFIGYLRQPFIIAARRNCGRSATPLQNRDVAALLSGKAGVIGIMVG